jgi:hypothetical protein
MERDPSRCWRTLWADALERVNATDVRAGLNQERPAACDHCAAHAVQDPNCLVCFVYQEFAQLASTAPLLRNDAVHFRQVVVAGLQLLLEHHYEMDQQAVRHMVQGVIRRGASYVAGLVYCELGSDGHLDSPSSISVDWSMSGDSSLDSDN